MHISKFVLSLALLPALFAQSERGSIAGIVTDPTGAAVASAEVVVTQVATNATFRSATTGTGEYSVPNLLPGEYRVEVSAPGFKRSIQQNVIVAASTAERAVSSIQLAPCAVETGPIRTTVESLTQRWWKVTSSLRAFRGVNLGWPRRARTDAELPPFGRGRSSDHSRNG